MHFLTKVTSLKCSCSSNMAFSTFCKTCGLYFIYLFIYLFIYSFIHSFIHLFIYLSIYLFIYLLCYRLLETIFNKNVLSLRHLDKNVQIFKDMRKGTSSRKELCYCLLKSLVHTGKVISMCLRVEFKELGLPQDVLC